MDAVSGLVLGSSWAGLPPAGKIFLAIGAIMGARVALSTLRWVYAFFLRPAINVKKLGAWGVVTGATDGIGKAVAMELAKKGLNIVLISRTQARLDAAKDEIKAKCPKVEVTTMACDFSTASDADYAKLKSAIEALADGVAVLYNNVGVSYEHAEQLQDVSDAQIDSIIEVNNRALVKMSKMVIPGMRQRRKGAVINVTSFEGSINAPFYSIYGASKAFIDSFSASMAVELQGTGVTMASHAPLYVVTPYPSP